MPHNRTPRTGARRAGVVWMAILPTIAETRRRKPGRRPATHPRPQLSSSLPSSKCLLARTARRLDSSSRPIRAVCGSPGVSGARRARRWRGCSCIRVRGRLTGQRRALPADQGAPARSGDRRMLVRQTRGRRVGRTLAGGRDRRAGRRTSRRPRCLRVESPRGLPIGLFGHSQGGWVVVEAAGRGAPVAFVITNSGPGVSPAQQERYSLAGKLTDGREAEALATYDAVVAVMSECPTLDKGVARLEAAEVPYRELPGLEFMFEDEAIWGLCAKIFDYDPASALSRITVPVLRSLRGGRQDHPRRRERRRLPRCGASGAPPGRGLPRRRPPALPRGAAALRRRLPRPDQLVRAGSHGSAVGLAHSSRAYSSGVAAPAAHGARAVRGAGSAGSRSGAVLACPPCLRRSWNLARHLRDAVLDAPAAGGGGDVRNGSVRRPETGNYEEAVDLVRPQALGRFIDAADVRECAWSPGTCLPSSTQRRTRAEHWRRFGFGAKGGRFDRRARHRGQPRQGVRCEASACCSFRPAEGGCRPPLSPGGDDSLAGSDLQTPHTGPTSPGPLARPATTTSSCRWPTPRSTSVAQITRA